LKELVDMLVWFACKIYAEKLGSTTDYNEWVLYALTKLLNDFGPTIKKQVNDR